MPPIMFFSNFPMSYARWASTPMFYSQCNCNNGGNNQWMNWWMMSEMVKNIGQMFRKPEKQPPYAYNPYQQYINPYQTMYPYVNLNNTQQYPLTEQDEGIRDLQDAYKNCKTKFNFVKINDKYMAITKDNKRIKADTVEELMDAIDEYIAEGKGGVEKPEAKPEEVAQPDAVDETAEEAVEEEGGDDGTPAPARRVHVPDGWNRTNAKSFLDKDAIHPDAKYDKDKKDNEFYSNRQRILLENKNGKNAADITIDLLLKNNNLTISDDKQKELRKALIDANPSIYDGDGKLVKGVNAETLNTKLDLPDATVLKNTYDAYDRDNRTFKVDGKEMSETEYIEKYPDVYFKNDPKHYTKDNLKVALETYDREIGGDAQEYTYNIWQMENKETNNTQEVKNILKNIDVTTKDNDIIVGVDYNGNGIGKFWHYQIIYKNGAKNGINKSMKDIYESVIEKYNQQYDMKDIYKSINDA